MPKQEQLDKVTNFVFRIECGIQGSLRKTNYPHYWPLLKCTHLPFSLILKQISEEFIFIFTSVHAVESFFETTRTSLSELTEKHKNWIIKYFEALKKNRICFFAVGETTARFLSEKIDAPCAWPQKRNGLENLLKDEIFKKKQKTCSEMVILTSNFGKTKSVLKKFQKIHAQVIECYKLEDSRESFLKNFFSDKKIDEENFIFYGFSGAIMDLSIKKLMEYFHVSTAKDLPKTIHFMPWERSAKEVLTKYGLSLFEEKILSPSKKYLKV